MPNKQTMLKFHMADGGTGSGNSRFFCSTDELDQYAEYLTQSKGKLVELQGNLKTEVGGITTGWADSDGTSFKEKFNSFLAEAEKINSELETLASFATGESEKYQGILKESIRIMTGG